MVNGMLGKGQQARSEPKPQEVLYTATLSLSKPCHCPVKKPRLACWRMRSILSVTS